MDLKKKALLARVWSLWGCVLLAPVAAVAQEAAVEVVEVDCTVPLQAFMNPEVCRLGGTSSESKSVSSVSTPQAGLAAAPVAPPLPARQGGGGGNGAPGNGPAGGGGGNGPQPPRVGVPPVVNPLVQPSQQPPVRTAPPAPQGSPVSSHHSSESAGSEDSSGREELNISAVMNAVAHDLQDPDLTLDDIQEGVAMANRLRVIAQRMRQNAGEDFDAPELDAAQRNLDEAVRVAGARAIAAENLRRAARGDRVEVLEDEEAEGGNEQVTGSVVPPLHQPAAFGRAPSPTLTEMMESVAEDLENPDLTPAQREVIEAAAGMLMEQAAEIGADLHDNDPRSRALEHAYNRLEQAFADSVNEVPVVQIDLSGEGVASPRQVIEAEPLGAQGMQALDLEGDYYLLPARPAAPEMPLSARGSGGVNVDIAALRALATERAQARRQVPEEEDYEDDFEIDSSVGDAADIEDILSLSGLDGNEVVVADGPSAPPSSPTSAVDEAEVIVINPLAVTAAAQRLQQEEAEMEAMRARMAQQPTLAERVAAFAALRDQIPAEPPVPAAVSGRNSVASVGEESQPPRSVVVDTSLTPETTPRSPSTLATPTVVAGSASVPPLNLSGTRKRVSIQEPEEGVGVNQKINSSTRDEFGNVIPLSISAWMARERDREFAREDRLILEERVRRELEEERVRKELEDKGQASPRTSSLDERNAAWAQAYQEGLRDPEYPERGRVAGVFSPPEVAYDVDAAPTVTNQPTSVLAVGRAVTPRDGAAASARENADQRIRELFSHMETLARNPENSPEAIFTTGVNMVREIAQSARPNDRQALEMIGIDGIDRAIDRGQVIGAEERLAQLSGLPPLAEESSMGETVAWIERAVQVARQKAEEEGRETSSSNSVPAREAVDQTADRLIGVLWRLHRGTPEGEEIIRLDGVVFPRAADHRDTPVSFAETPRSERGEEGEDSQAELTRELRTAFAGLEETGSREALQEALSTYLAAVGALEIHEIGVREVSPALAAGLEQAQTALTQKLVEAGEDVSDLPKWQEALGGGAAPAAGGISPRSAASEDDDYADDDFEDDDDEESAPAAAPTLTVTPPTPHTVEEEMGMLTIGGLSFDEEAPPVVVVPVREDVVVDGALQSAVVPVPVQVLPQEVTGPLSLAAAVAAQAAATDEIVESVREFQSARASGDLGAIQQAQVKLVDAADHAGEVLAASPPPATPQQQQVATETQVAAAMAKDVVAMTAGGSVQRGRFEVRDVPQGLVVPRLDLGPVSSLPQLDLETPSPSSSTSVSEWLEIRQTHGEPGEDDDYDDVLDWEEEAMTPVAAVASAPQTVAQSAAISQPSSQADLARAVNLVGREIQNAERGKTRDEKDAQNQGNNQDKTESALTVLRAMYADALQAKNSGVSLSPELQKALQKAQATLSIYGSHTASASGAGGSVDLLNTPKDFEEGDEDIDDLFAETPRTPVAPSAIPVMVSGRPGPGLTSEELARKTSDEYRSYREVEAGERVAAVQEDVGSLTRQMHRSIDFSSTDFADTVIARHNAIVRLMKDEDVTPEALAALARERDALRKIVEQEDWSVQRCGEDLQSGPCENHEIE